MRPDISMGPMPTTSIKKIREEYIRKTEANKKYGAVAAEIRTLEEEIAQLEALLPQKGREKG